MSSPEEQEEESQQQQRQDEETAVTTATATETATETETVTVTVTVTPPEEHEQEEQAEELPLDWTKLGVGADESIPLRYPIDVAEFSTEDLDICVVGTAGRKITHMGTDFSQRYCNPDLETLVLRSHLIPHMEGLECFQKLKLLELYDNMVQELQCLDMCGPNLNVLDMSYNVIRDLSPVSVCQNLTELYIANNKLKHISGLEALVQLKKIDLGANRIRVMEGLDGLVNLEELWLGKNKIEEIRGLECLVKLRRLDVQSNRLTRIENLNAQQEALEELYLAHNAIDDEGASCETGLAMTFPNLNVLDLSRNKLTSTQSFSHQPGLEDLWLSGNNMDTFDAVVPLKEAAEAGTQHLETLYLEYNPVASEFGYRKTLAAYIPCLKQIDATLIGGLAAHGLPGVALLTAPPMEEQLRQYQAAAVERAQQETKENNNN
jgi:protein phosphatase 1 regulatory subunit 7